MMDPASLVLVWTGLGALGLLATAVMAVAAWPCPHCETLW